MTLVSIIIPVYNQAEYLGIAIESALKQTHRDLEVLVVNDGSTDHTAEVAKDYSDPRVSYIYQENRGLAAARNTGIINSRGTFLSFLDGDDEFLADNLYVLLNAMEGCLDVGLAAGQVIPIDANGIRNKKIFDAGLHERPEHLLLKNPFQVGGILVRRSWQERVGLFDENLRSCEDWDMWLRLAEAGCQMVWVDKPVSLYRFHKVQMTRDGHQMTEANFAVLDKIFNNPDLGEPWKQLYNQAYCQAHLRAAANTYLLRDFVSAKKHLMKATSYSPELLNERTRCINDSFMAWTELPKVQDPISFLNDIYTNLPDVLQGIRRQADIDISNAALRIAFEAYACGDGAGVRKNVLYALRRQPSLLGNRGVLSILLKSFLNHSRESERPPQLSSSP